jgi:hypothetical protein
VSAGKLADVIPLPRRGEPELRGVMLGDYERGVLDGLVLAGVSRTRSGALCWAFRRAEDKIRAALPPIFRDQANGRP